MEQSASMEEQTGYAWSEADADRAFGFWLYLMSDAVIFALLFGTYMVMSRNYAGGPTGRELFDLGRTFAETMLLLMSSVSYGFASLAIALGRRALSLVWLGATFLLGGGFVWVEVGELHGMVERGAGPDRSGFLSALFTLVGTHGLHVCVGLMWILVMMAQIMVDGLTGPVRSRLLRLGMFWHFLDLVWVGIFSIVYLLGSV